jgi:hypothetical protein
MADRSNDANWRDAGAPLTLDGAVRLAISAGQHRAPGDTLFITLVCDGQPCQVPYLAESTPQAALIHWRDLPGDAQAELRIIAEETGLRWSVALSGLDHSWRLSFPFLGQLGSPGERRLRDSRGRPICYRADWPPPYLWQIPGGPTITLLVEPLATPMPFDTPALWSEPGLSFTTSAEPQMLFEAELAWHSGGWPAAFERYRARVRESIDLAQYQRADLAWFQDQLVQHFTFLYGRELLNMQTGQFEIDRFLDDAERDFGGYDGMLLWGGYPRLGIDERSQWDFFDDLPGGRASLRTLARRARERGVRVFVPYKPWDRSAELHGQASEPDHLQLTRLVADIEADAVFLDTMSAIGGAFRASIDQARPGVALCSEGRARGPALEVITSSWDQLAYVDTQQGNWSAAEVAMPAVNLLRFLIPEHRLFVIGRHALGDDRVRAIQRGFFNGMGWVVWQDVFGMVQPYTPAEAALLKRCRTLLREHRRALASPQPTPLIDTLAPGIYANVFPGATKRLWTLYNETDSLVDAPVLHIQPRQGYHLVDVWAGQEIVPDAAGNVRLALAPRAVGALAELPQLLRYVDAERQIALAEPPNDAEVQISAGGSTWSQPAGQPIGMGSWLGLSTPLLVRLLQQGELLDQIVVAPRIAGGQP